METVAGQVEPAGEQREDAAALCPGLDLWRRGHCWEWGEPLSAREVRRPPQVHGGLAPVVLHSVPGLGGRGRRR